MAAKIKGLYLKNDVWWFQPPMENYVRPKPFSLGTKIEAEAIALALRESNQVAILGAETWDVEIAAHLRERQEKNRLSPASVGVRRYTLRQFAQAVGTRRPDQVTPGMAQEFYDGLKARGLVESSAQSAVWHVRAFFRWLVEKQRIRENPIRVEMRRVKTHFHHPFVKPDVVTRLIDEAPHDELRFILLCGFDAGLRRMEIVNATPAWFGTAGIVRVLNDTADFESKDGDERFIPLTRRFEKFLKKFGRPEPYMLAPWKEEKGRSLYRYDFRRPFEDYMKAQKLEWVTPHTMRHSFASNLVSAGVSLYKVSKWLGDDPDVTTRHYGHLSPERDAEVEKMVG